MPQYTNPFLLPPEEFTAWIESVLPPEPEAEPEVEPEDAPMTFREFLNMPGMIGYSTELIDEMWVAYTTRNPRLNDHAYTCPPCFVEAVRPTIRYETVMPAPLDIQVLTTDNTYDTSTDSEDEETVTLVTEAPPIEEDFVTANECRCEACKIINPRLGDPSKLKHGRVHSYSYKPRRWVPKMVKGETPKYFLGVELETDNYSSRGQRDRFGRRLGMQYSPLTNGMAADMRLPKRLWVPKQDGSVTGPEFASHPASMAFWTAHKREIKQMFMMLLHAGYRSHDNDNAGMHVNISKSAFDDADHLYKFITLVHFSPVWSRRMAQRTETSVNSWAKLNLGNDKETRRKLSLWAMYEGPYFQRPQRPYVDRYTALNIPSNGEARFEFRLPRGTLRVDRFFKNLQWVESMIEYTRTSGVLESRPKAYMDYVVENKGQYPELTSFLAERAPKLKAALA